MTSTTLDAPATTRQLRYIIDMANAFDWETHVIGNTVRAAIYDAISTDGDPERVFIPRDEASDAIDVLIPLYRTLGKPQRNGKTNGGDNGVLAKLLAQINTGRYALPRKSDGVVDFFEVVERDGGKRYCNQLLGGSIACTKFHHKHLPVHLQAAAARAILVDQKAAALLYADTYHECPRCGVALTHPRSITARIGKQCASVWGWDW